MYFEKLHNIHLIAADWRVTLSIDISKLKTQFPLEYSELNGVYGKCLSLTTATACAATLRLPHVYGKADQALSLQDQLNEIITEFQTPESYDGPKTIRRRSAPFGFIGSISHTLFGILTTEDAEYYNSEIDKLYHNQNELAHIMENQAHIVRNGLHKLHQIFEKNTELISENRNRLNEITEAIQQEENSVNTLQYMMALSRFVHSIEISLDHYIKTAETYLAAIRAVKSGEVPHALLGRSISRRIISDIWNTQRNFDLPIPPGQQSLKELTRSTTVNAIIHQGRILIVLQLPLSEGTTYHLYRTYS
ncbi:uncharacterized protein LOC143305513 [Osmia lignaria lignaria]|uniref:uncharacterized protein LOC143305513 n=1 Tax=Osmia lignaria lignaria TaxID=1437193 RepID=UPI00402B6875